MAKVVQIGSLYYGAMVQDEDISVFTIGYSTYEQCLKMSRIDDI